MKRTKGAAALALCVLLAGCGRSTAAAAEVLQALAATAALTDYAVVADIITDGGRSVLRLRASGVTQRNQVMNFQPHEETGESKYSFAIFCKAITAGTLSVGIEGTEELYLEQELSPATEYQRISKVSF